MDRRSRDIEVEMTFLTAEAGGRTRPAFSGYRPQFFYDGHDWDAVHEYVGTEIVAPGDTVRAYLSFVSPDAHVGRLHEGMEFLIREGQRVIARGRVTRLIELEQSAKRVRGEPSPE